MKLHIVTFAWGEEAAGLLLSTLLPNQITPGNLGACRRSDCCYRIYTAAEDAPRIAAAPVTERLRQLLATDIVALPGLGAEAGSVASEADLLRAHRDAVATAEDANAALLYLPNNAIWSEGSFRRALELGADGKSAVLVLGLQVAREGFAPAFHARFFDPATLQAVAGAPDLVQLGLAHLHPMARALFNDAPRFARPPQQVIWRADGQGLAIKTFRLTPLLIRPKFPGTLVLESIEQDYWRKACPEPARHYVVQDSSEICKLSLEPQAVQHKAFFPGGLKLTEMAQFARGRYFEDIERSTFLDHTIRLHGTEAGAALQAAERQAKAFSDRLRFAMQA